MIGKVLLGVVLMLIGGWLLLPLGMGLPYQGIAWEDFKIVLWGVVPAFLIFIGLLTLWIESEDRKK